MTPLDTRANRGAVLSLFPELQPADLVVTSKRAAYNCVAWAVGDTGAWWEPAPLTTEGELGGGNHWPKGIPLQHHLANFLAVFEIHDFRECEGGELEEGREKIAVYVNDQGGFAHVARQLEDGRWSSKLGREFDISHASPDDLVSQSYGTPQIFMARPRKAYPHPRDHH